MPATQAILSFNAGELTPYLRHRTDFDKQASGAELMQNFIAMPFGGVRKRPGTRHVAALGGLPVRLETFQFNAEVSFILAFTAAKLTVFDSRGRGAVMATITGSFGDPFLLQFAQVNDVVFITSRGVSPKRLERLADDHWVMEEMPFSYQPFLSVNTDEAKVFHVRSTLYPLWSAGVSYASGGLADHLGSIYVCTSDHVASAATEPGAGVTWSMVWAKVEENFGQSRIGAGSSGYLIGPAFDPGQLESFYEISMRRGQDQFESTLSLRAPGALPGPVPSTSPPIIIKGKWSFITGGSWDGVVYIQRSYDRGDTWEDYRRYSSITENTQNFTSSGDEEKLCLMRIRYAFRAVVGVSAGSATLTSEEPYITGRVQIKEFPYAPDYTIAGFLAVDDIEPGATDIWSEGAFSAYQGYPAAVALHERRLVFAGTTRHPVSVWTSKTDDLLNFTPGSTEADASIFITLAATRQDPIRWIASQRRLVIGTAGSEWVFGSDTSDAALSPANLLVRQYTFFGSAALPALTMQSGVFFIERQGRRLRELAYQVDQESYDAADLTRLAEHITQGGLTQAAWQGNREPALWAVRADGTMVHFTYIRSEKVAAWSRHTTAGGQFTSVAVLRNKTEDDTVYVVVLRDGQYHLEYFSPGQQTAQENGYLAGCYHVDSGVFDHPDGNDQLDTPPHLDGRELEVLADGYHLKLTPAGGKLTLPFACSQAVAGLLVESRLITLPPEIQTDQGMTHGKLKRANNVKLSLYQSYGGSLIYRGQASDVTTTTPDTPLDAPPPLATGWYEMSLGGGYEQDLQFEIRHASPHPYTVRAAAVEWSVSEGR